MVQVARRLYLCGQCVRGRKALEKIKTKPVGPCGKCGKKTLDTQHARRCPRCSKVRCVKCKKLDMFKHGKKIWTCRMHHPHVPQNRGYVIDASVKSMVMPSVKATTTTKSKMNPVTACLICASYFIQDQNKLTEGLWRRPGNKRLVVDVSEKWDQGNVVSLSSLSPLDVCSLWKIYAHREDLPLGNDMTRMIFTETMNQDDLSDFEKVDAVWDLLCDLAPQHRKVVLSIAGHFEWVQRHNEITKMTSKTLSMCFWPRGSHIITFLSDSYPCFAAFIHVSKLLLIMESRKVLPSGTCSIILNRFLAPSTFIYNLDSKI